MSLLPEIEGLVDTEEQKQLMLELMSPCFEEMVTACIEATPADPVQFLLDWLEQSLDDRLSAEEKDALLLENKRLETLLAEAKGGKIANQAMAVKHRRSSQEALARKAHELAALQGNQIFPAYNVQARDAVANDCFKHDFSLVKTWEIVSESEKDELESVLRPNYYWVVSLYRKLSSLDANLLKPKAGVALFAVSSRDAMNLLDTEKHDGANLLDKSHLTKTRAELCFKEANENNENVSGGRKKFAVQNDKGLVRYQFLEWLLRIAKIKYPNTPIGESTDKLLKKLSTLTSKYSGDVKYLFEAGSSKAFGAAHEELEKKLETLYKKAAKDRNTGHNTKKHGAASDSKTRRMTLHDWANFLKEANAYVLYPGLKKDDTAYIFRLGLETRDDEQFSETFQEMSLMEFSRAVAAMLFTSEMHTAGSCDGDRLAKLLREFVVRAVALGS